MEYGLRDPERTAADEEWKAQLARMYSTRQQARKHSTNMAGAAKRRWENERGSVDAYVERIKDFAARGLTAEEIADEEGLPIGAVLYFLER